MVYKGKGCKITIVCLTFSSFSLATRHATFSVWCGRAKHGQILSLTSHRITLLSSSSQSSPFGLFPSFFSSPTNRRARNGYRRSSRDSCCLLCRFRLDYPTNRTQTSQAWFPIQCHRRWCVSRPLSHLSICGIEIFSFNGVLVIRSDRFGKVDPHQHYICFTPHRLEGQA